MKFLKVLALIVAILVALFFVVGLLLPSRWTVSEAQVIRAKPADIYPWLANLKRWQDWSSWNDLDLTMQSTYSGPQAGAGAQWNWTSDKMGTGWLKIDEATPDQDIKYTLFIDMNGSQTTIHGQLVMVANPNAHETLVTWTDHGDAGDNVFQKWMALIMGAMIKREMASGLQTLNNNVYLQVKQ